MLTDKTTVSTTELALVLGLTARRIQQMAQDGTITAESRGRFRLSSAIKQYMDFIQDRKRKIVTEEDLKIDRQVRKAEADLKQTKATVSCLELEEIEGKVHRSEDVTEIMDEMIFEIRDALLILPNLLSINVANARTPAEAQAIIQKEVDVILKALKCHMYDPKKYKEKVLGRLDWQGSGRDTQEE